MSSVSATSPQVQDKNGAIGFKIYAVFLFEQQGCDCFLLIIDGTVNGQPYTTISYAMDCHCGPVIVVNGDSGKQRSGTGTTTTTSPTGRVTKPNCVST